MTMRRPFLAATLAALSLHLVPANAVSVGQLDDFEDGTTQNWIVGLLGAPHPAPPVNVPSGGPDGGDDAYLQITSIGTDGPGSKLAVVNLVQWAGDYASAGVSGISADVRNFGQTEVALRLFLENPRSGPPTDTAITGAVILPPGSGWMSVVFSLAPGDLSVLQGDLATLLADVTALRFFHGGADTFTGESLVAQVGIDNVLALGVRRVPEPGTLALLSLGLLGAVMLRRRNLRRITP